MVACVKDYEIFNIDSEELIALVQTSTILQDDLRMVKDRLAKFNADVKNDFSQAACDWKDAKSLVNKTLES